MWNLHSQNEREREWKSLNFSLTFHRVYIACVLFCESSQRFWKEQILLNYSIGTHFKMMMMMRMMVSWTSHPSIHIGIQYMYTHKEKSLPNSFILCTLLTLSYFSSLLIVALDLASLESSGYKMWHWFPPTDYCASDQRPFLFAHEICGLLYPHYTQFHSLLFTYYFSSLRHLSLSIFIKPASILYSTQHSSIYTLWWFFAL